MRKKTKAVTKQTQEKTGQMKLSSDTYNGLLRDTKALPVQSPLLPFFALTWPFLCVWWMPRWIFKGSDTLHIPTSLLHAGLS